MQFEYLENNVYLIAAATLAVSFDSSTLSVMLPSMRTDCPEYSNSFLKVNNVLKSINEQILKIFENE